MHRKINYFRFFFVFFVVFWGGGYFYTFHKTFMVCKITDDNSFAFGCNILILACYNILSDIVL